MNRRNFLKGTGIITVLFTGGGIWRAIDKDVFKSGQGVAYEPWNTWREDSSDGPLSLINSAILAANPHNTQPWLFKVTADNIQIFADASRHLGTMDVYLREMHIGLGCAIENMVLAAKAKGYSVDLTLEAGDLTSLTMDSKSIHCATLNLSPAKSTLSELYHAIPKRHTDRAVYDKTKLIANDDLNEIIRLSNRYDQVKVFLFSQEEDLALLTKGSVQATKDIINDKIMAHDSAKWFRHSWDEVQKYKDGPYIDTAGISPLMRAMSKMLPPMSEETENKYWLKATLNTLKSTPVMGIIAVRDLYDRPQTLQSGQLWQQMHLWATTHGISMQPVNQMPEVVDRERQLKKEAKTSRFLEGLTRDSSWGTTFVFRMGYPTMKVLPSPRRPVKETLIG